MRWDWHTDDTDWTDFLFHEKISRPVNFEIYRLFHVMMYRFDCVKVCDGISKTFFVEKYHSRITLKSK